MKKIIIGFVTLTSLSSFAEVYKGIDSHGSFCELNIVTQNVAQDKYLIQVNTKTIQASSTNAIKVDEIIEASNVFTQGNQDYILKTTDWIVIQFDGPTPARFSVHRKKVLKKNGLSGIFTSKRESLPEVLCNLI